ncbi:hypothetical protein [Burkholderia glumae]|uniref:hypothetical protein n=1 Tax=Burkholderia glumae TaxID=337 RepID=UPI0005644C89|nr:hypothetical protein [Burkholderia glumae]QKM57737.1 hypothetical protein CG017_05817 [Burkholderia glumae]
MADPQTVTLVMTQAAAQPVNWWVVGASSAVVSAVVNGGFKWWEIHTARRDAQARRAEQRAPALLNVARLLEAFARQAVGYLDGCEAQISACFAEMHGDAPGDLPKWTPLTFDTSIVADWTDVPVAIVSQCQELPIALEASHGWIDQAAREWADNSEAYELDRQRAILYGTIAAELARQIRADIKTDPSVLAQDCAARLLREYHDLQQRYGARPGEVELIPDLRARFEREHPELRSARVRRASEGA